MKKYIYKIFLGIFMVSLFSACESDDYMPDLVEGYAPLFNFADDTDFLIENPGFIGKVTVDMYFDVEPVDSRLVVAHNGDYENTQVLESSIKSFPIDVEISYQDLLNLFGLDEIAIGDQFEVGLDVLATDGEWYPAFNPQGVAYSSDIYGFPETNPVVSFRSVCDLNLDDFTGTAMLHDEFWGYSYEVEVTKISDNQLQINGYFEEAAPNGIIIIDVNLQRHLVSAEKQIYYPDEMWGYRDFAFGPGSGSLDACAFTISITGEYTVNVGSFGNYNITLEF